MEESKSNFIDVVFPGLLKKLTPQTERMWGQMNPQQMVEHLTDYVRVASGKTPVAVMTSEEQLPAYRRFLESEKEFRPETKNPLNTGAPAPVRNTDLKSAIDEYLAEMKDFHSAFASDPSLTTSHPAFGFLNRDEWMKLQYKHLKHHARQFGLI